MNEIKYRRVMWISTIKSHYVRRAAMSASLPILLLWSLVLWIINVGAVILWAPFFFGRMYWPVEIFRSFAKVWKAPRDKSEQPK